MYRACTEIYTTINASMQEYAEQALFDHMKNKLQPRLDQQIKNTNRTFVPLNKD